MGERRGRIQNSGNYLRACGIAKLSLNAMKISKIVDPPLLTFDHCYQQIMRKKLQYSTESSLDSHMVKLFSVNICYVGGLHTIRPIRLAICLCNPTTISVPACSALLTCLYQTMDMYQTHLPREGTDPTAIKTCAHRKHDVLKRTTARLTCLRA